MQSGDPDPGTVDGPPTPASPSFLRPGERMPWLLRQPARDDNVAPQDRASDRAAALDARRTALLVTPAVGLVWVLVAIFGGEDALRIATISALVVCVAIGVRAAVTTQRFRRRWMDPADVKAPPVWVTLATVAAAVAAVVAVANVAADLQSDRSAVRAIVSAVIALAILGLGSYAHIAGGRSVGAALRE